MGTDENHELLRASVDALEEISGALDTIHPTLALALGDIAARGATAEDQARLDTLADVSDKIQTTLNFVYDAINSATRDFYSERQASATQEEATDSVASDEPHTESDFDYEVISEIGLTPNEKAATILVLNHLKQSEERHGFRDLLRVAFGRSRITRNEERKFSEILGLLSEYGVVRRYGKAFSNSSAYVYLTNETRTEEEKPLDDVELGIVEYVQSQIDESTTTINIGQIIRKHLGVEVLPKDEHQELIRVLNSLVDRGYMTHKPHTPWYGVGERPARIDTTLSTQIILTPALQPLEELVTGTLESIPEPTPTEQETNIEGEAAPGTTSVEQMQIELDSLTREVLEFAYGNDFFRMEELHKGVASLAELANKDDRYKEFKANFSKTRDLIVAALKGQGVVAHWEEAGRNKGKKYKLVVEGQPPVQEKKRARPSKKEKRPVSGETTSQRSVVEQPRREYHRPPTRPLTDSERKIKWRRDAFFAQKLIESVTEILEDNEDRRLRVTAVSREIASGLGVSEDEAREAVEQLIKTGAFHNGNQDGSKMISLIPIETNGGNGVQSEAEKRRKREFKALREEDIAIANLVYDELLKLQHVQQGIEPKDLIRALEVKPEDEEEFRRALRRLEEKQLIVMKHNANPNTRSAHSRTIRVPWVLLPSQEFKDRLKTSRSEVFAEIRDMVEEDKTTVAV